MEYLKVSEEEIEEVMTSVNAPFVAAPGHSSEPARAYICSIRHGQGRLSLYIFLHLSQSNKGLLYSYDKESLGSSDYAAARGEATEFVESMGFIMEKADFKGKAIDSLPPFMKDLSVLGKEEEDEEVELTEITEEQGRKGAKSVEAVPADEKRSTPKQDEEVELTEISDEEGKKEVKSIKVAPASESRPVHSKGDIEIEVESPVDAVTPVPSRAAKPSISEEGPLAGIEIQRPQGKRMIGKIKLKDIMSSAGEDKQMKMQVEPVIRFLSSL